MPHKSPDHLLFIWICLLHLLQGAQASFVCLLLTPNFQLFVYFLTTVCLLFQLIFSSFVYCFSWFSAVCLLLTADFQLFAYFWQLFVYFWFLIFSCLFTFWFLIFSCLFTFDTWQNSKKPNPNNLTWGLKFCSAYPKLDWSPCISVLYRESSTKRVSYDCQKVASRVWKTEKVQLDAAEFCKENGTFISFSLKSISLSRDR